MREVDGDRPLKAPPDKALVVFVRSARLGFAVRAEVMDDQARFLGTAIAGGHFAVERQPGPQRFVLWSEATDVLIADLAPGLVYFVEVVPHMGVMRARFTFKAAHRGTDLFPYSKEDLDGTKRYLVDGALVRNAMPDVEERRDKLKDAQDDLSGLSSAELAEHTLVPNDGHLEAGQPSNGPMGLPPPAPPSATPPRANPVPEQRRFGKGSTVRISLKSGVQWMGEVVTETERGLLLTVGDTTQMFGFIDIEKIETLTETR